MSLELLKLNKLAKKFQIETSLKQVELWVYKTLVRALARTLFRALAKHRTGMSEQAAK